MRCGGSIRSASAACRRSPASSPVLPRWSPIRIEWPDEAWRGYYDDGYLSKFARSGVTAVSDFINYGFMESDAVATERLKVPLLDSCHPTGRAAQHHHDP